jgi:hypothetical protein
MAAQFLETNTFKHNLPHDWYIVDGQKYAVTRESGDYPLLCDSEGVPVARLDRTGHVIHPMQLRYNAIYCDPAARENARVRFQAVSDAIRTCITPMQHKAITTYAHINGRLWKSNLRRDWERSHYPYFDSELAPYLQELRNERGYRWLDRFKVDREALKAFGKPSAHAA